MYYISIPHIKSPLLSSHAMSKDDVINMRPVAQTDDHALRNVFQSYFSVPIGKLFRCIQPIPYYKSSYY